MTTLSSESTIEILDAATVTETADVFVLPIAGPGEGKGRLIHPTLGTFDYGFAPDSWRGFRRDVHIEPVWSAVTTLGGVALTLWQGNIRDRIVEERWIDDIAMSVDDLDVLLSFAAAPPDPRLGTPDGFIQWFPSYCCDLGFYIAELRVTTGGGSDLEIDGVIDDNEWAPGPVVVSMRIVERVV